MGNLLRHVGLMFVATFFIVITITFGISRLTDVSDANSLQNVSRIQAFLNHDDASRLKPGQFWLQQANFEKDVVRDFGADRNFGVNGDIDNEPTKHDTANDGIKFSYLVQKLDKTHTDKKGKPEPYYVTKQKLDPQDNVIAIKAKTNVKGKPHATNLVLLTSWSTHADDINQNQNPDEKK